MVDYRYLYHWLFGAVSDAADALEASESERAKEILLCAMQKCEESVIENGGNFFPGASEARPSCSTPNS